MYADYEYYVTGYLLGRDPIVSKEIFPYWEKQARAFVDLYTFDRLKAGAGLITEEVKDCVCAIIELLYKADQVAETALQEGAAGPLASYSNDGQSGTYRLEDSVYTEAGKKAECRRLIRQYLANTGLLYAGIGRCGCC